jgi:hypothetical protein
MQFLFEKIIAMVSFKHTEEALHYFYDVMDHGDSGCDRGHSTGERERELQCFFMLVPSDVSHFSFCEFVSWGLYEIPFRCGWDVTSRLLVANDWFDGIYAEVAEAYPNSLQLQRMVVLPPCQGRGTVQYTIHGHTVSCMELSALLSLQPSSVQAIDELARYDRSMPNGTHTFTWYGLFHVRCSMHRHRNQVFRAGAAGKSRPRAKGCNPQHTRSAQRRFLLATVSV